MEKKIELFREQVIQSCICLGIGCWECASKNELVLGMAEAKIPLEYWSYSIKTFNGNEEFKSLIINIKKNIKEIFANGNNYSLVGRLGVGKTFGACEILKAVIKENYNGKYTLMTEMIDNITNKTTRFDYKQAMKNADFLVIDEFDRRHIPNSDAASETFAAAIESIVRHRLQNKLPTIFCSNEETIQDVFIDNLHFADVFKSLMLKNITEISVQGIDLRKSK